MFYFFSKYILFREKKKIRGKKRKEEGKKRGKKRGKNEKNLIQKNEIIRLRYTFWNSFKCVQIDTFSKIKCVQMDTESSILLLALDNT